MRIYFFKDHHSALLAFIIIHKKAHLYNIDKHYILHHKVKTKIRGVCYHMYKNAIVKSTDQEQLWKYINDY